MYKHIKIKNIMKKRIGILVLNILILFAIVGWRRTSELTTIFGNDVIGQEKVSEIITNKVMNEEISIYFNDCLAPLMDEKNTILLSQKCDNLYYGNLSSGGYIVNVVKPTNDKKYLMFNNLPLQVLVYNENEYKLFNIKMTNLPVIGMNPQSYEYDIYRDGSEYEIVTGTLSLFNSNGNNDAAFEIYTGNCIYHIRGAGSRVFPKQSFKLNTIDSDGDAKDVELLGMRKDNDWNLNAMYLDETKVREKIAYTFWNEMNTITKHQSEYVELIIDGRYRGLYLLQEPSDHITFNSKKNKDYLYAVKLWKKQINVETLFDDSVLDDRNEIIDEYEIKKINDIEYEKAVDVLRSVASDLNNEQPILNYDINSYVNYGLLINMIGATDNNYKNQIFLARKKYDNYIIEKTVWDLDLSLGEDQYFDHTISFDEMIIDEFVPKYIKTSEEYELMQKELYQVYRDRFFRVEIFDELLEYYTGLIENGAAIKRELERWDYQKEYEQEKELLKEYFNARIEVLDEYYDYGG